MNNINPTDLNELKKFLEWRRKNPKEYTQFKEDLKGFIKDMAEITSEAI